MAKIYQAPKANRNAALSIVLGCLFTFFIFLLVPLTQFIADVSKAEDSYEVQQASLPPPEEFEFEEEEIEEVEEEEEPPELEEEPPQLTLEQLDLALNPGMGGDLAGDFALPGFSSDDSKLNLDDIFDLNEVDQKPKAVKQVKPTFPRNLQRKGVSGAVRVIFVVDQNGDVGDITIVKTSHEEFADAVLEVLPKWKFEPAMKDGQKVKARVRIQIPFRNN